MKLSLTLWRVAWLAWTVFFLSGCNDGGSVQPPIDNIDGSSQSAIDRCMEDAISLGKPDSFVKQRIAIQWDGKVSNYVYQRQAIHLAIPSDLVGVVFTLDDPTHRPGFLETRIDGRLVSASYETSDDIVPLSKGTGAWANTVSVGFPSNQKTIPTKGKCIELDLLSVGANKGESANLYISSLRRPNAARGGNLDIQARVLDDAITTEQLASLNAALEQSYRQACLGRSHCFIPHLLNHYVTLETTSGAGTVEIPKGSDIQDQDALFNQISSLTCDDITADNCDNVERGVNIVFVKELLWDTLSDDLQLLGFSGGIPATPFDGTDASSLFISVDAHRLNGGTLSIPLLASTIAHELGHTLGLFHTTEQEGKMFDPIDDTPECSAKDHTLDDKDRVRAQTCQDADGNNLMFWEVDPMAFGSSVLSQTQVMVLRSHPLVYRDIDVAP